MGRYKLTLAEQETTINFDNELPTANIYTHDLRLINKLKELSEKYPNQFILIRKGPQRAVTYRIPKRCIGIRPPYSEERKQRQVRDAKANGLPFSNPKKEVDHNE